MHFSGFPWWLIVCSLQGLKIECQTFAYGRESIWLDYLLFFCWILFASAIVAVVVIVIDNHWRNISILHRKHKKWQEFYEIFRAVGLFAFVSAVLWQENALISRDMCIIMIHIITIIIVVIIMLVITGGKVLFPFSELWREFWLTFVCRQRTSSPARRMHCRQVGRSLWWSQQFLRNFMGIIQIGILIYITNEIFLFSS